MFVNIKAWSLINFKTLSKPFNSIELKYLYTFSKALKVFIELKYLSTFFKSLKFELKIASFFATFVLFYY